MCKNDFKMQSLKPVVVRLTLHLIQSIPSKIDKYGKQNEKLQTPAKKHFVIYKYIHVYVYAGTEWRLPF